MELQVSSNASQTVITTSSFLTHKAIDVSKRDLLLLRHFDGVLIHHSTVNDELHNAPGSLDSDPAKGKHLSYEAAQLLTDV